ncbi:phage holin [Lysinibacillus sp. NPDC086135]|uniref:phage holin n=1 Tax=Lysinibacillus sp. NPDC086135 TaxID=3364130 RepID=UPI00380686C4
MKINWKVRFQSKQFLTSLLALLVVLANQIAAVFGYDITLISQEITNISETVLLILGLLGVVVDNTTKGISDSEQALKYNERK